MAKWSALLVGMPKPNTPIAVVQGSTVFLARLRRRDIKRRGVFWWSSRPGITFAININPADEGVTWARGHSGPAVDALTVRAALVGQESS
jgi:hypothetical protein